MHSLLRSQSSRRGSRLLLAGIFVIFAPIGILVGLVQSPTQPAGWAFALALSAVSGLQAIGWATILQRRGWWLLLIPVLIWFPFRGAAITFNWLHAHGLLAAGYQFSGPARQAVLLVLGCAELALGFTLISLHIGRSERAAARARAELEMASRIHATLVPPIDVARDGWRVLASSRASSEMGGDLVDCVALAAPPVGGRDGAGATHIDAYLADVSGHGVGAGMVMGMVKSAVRMRLLSHSSLDQLVGDLNRVLADLTRPDMFATFACVRAWADGQAEFVLAGHLPIMLCRAQSSSAPGVRVEELHNNNLPLGIEAEERFVSGRVQLETGDTLVIVTDGLTEVQNREGRELGLSAIRTVVAASAVGPIEQLMAALIAAADGHGRQIDDQSILIVRRTGQ